MTSSVGRNSLIMASGTAASRISGQIRTILLAAAMGTTGIAANAYQAGSMIPQVVFTLVSGGIFNAVLVPQIVRTLREKDAQNRLNKLITFAIVLLLGVTLLMTVSTPLLTRLYANGGGPDMIALTNAFTLWCMPQIFFYGLYTVLGQILAAKNHFGMYAWSSVGANLISCAGFTAFIVLFGKANEQPLSFWTNGRIALTAGTWTLGVGFQALILFLPLMHLGIRYRPNWGFRGIGLRSMGPVAAWSVGIVAVDQLATIINTRITTSAPNIASRMLGISQFAVAGNASYQNAYTIYILPYSLIAVSVATAIFPKISQAVATRDITAARDDLSQALRNVGLLMCFFSVAFLVFPKAITLALLPSISEHEVTLMSGPLMMLALGLPLSSAYLIIQRTFYAFEDGRHPFIFVVLQSVIQIAVLLIGLLFVPATGWTELLGAAISAGYILAFPALVWMLRKRFGGFLDGRRIAATYVKAGAASAAALAIGWWLRGPLDTLVGAGPGVRHAPGTASMNWFQAVAVCIMMTVVIAAVYFTVLKMLRTEELGALAAGLPYVREHVRRAPRKGPSHAVMQPQPRKIRNTVRPTPVSTIPTYRMSTASQQHINVMRQEIGTNMKPQLGDIVINRYTLISLLRDDPGIQAWRANDRVLARDCQLFIVSDTRVMAQVDAIASSLALSRNSHFTQVLQLQHCGDVSIIITRLDAGLSLTQYLQGAGRNTLSFNAMRSILAETAMALQQLLADRLCHTSLSTDTIRITLMGIQIADTPISPLLADCTNAPQGLAMEQLATRQLAGVLYAMLTHTPSSAGTPLDLSRLPDGIPSEFEVLCTRGMSVLGAPDQHDLPMASLSELVALLGDWTPFSQLRDRDIARPSIDGACSIMHAKLNPVSPDRIVPLPEALTAVRQLSTPMPNADATANTALTGAPGNSTGLNPGGHNASPSTTHTTNGTPSSDAGARPGSAGVVGGGIAAANAGLSLAGGTLKSWWSKGKSAISGAHAEDEQPESPDGSNPVDGNTGDIDFHDIAAAEMAGILAPSNPSTQDMLFPSFNVQQGPLNDSANPTMQFDFSRNPRVGKADHVGQNDSDHIAATGRIPVIDRNGFPIEPGAESQRALEQERAEIKRAAQEASVPPHSILPPSFTPKSDDSGNDDSSHTGLPDGDDNISNARLFGGFTTKVVAIAVVIALVALGLALALRSLSERHDSQGITQVQSSQWPKIDMNDIPFGKKSGGSSSSSSSASAESTASSTAKETSKPSTTAKPDKTAKTPTIVTTDKNASKVPSPRVPVNNTPYDIDKQEFLTNPAGQRGLGYYMHLSQPESAYRFVIKIRSSGGKAYLRANTSSNPTQGQQVAEFTFDASGTTTVKFTKPVTSQDFLLWVPMDSLPNNQLYIDSVQLF